MRVYISFDSSRRVDQENVTHKSRKALFQKLYALKEGRGLKKLFNKYSKFDFK